ncbi:MAG TPA: cell division protein FtsH, partial [Candidatus Saccharimonadales bacterium]|nr:cell division protein FtsH [Candidatus Saccharimonadales bacterium]
ANLANESAIIAARRKSKTIQNNDVTEAFERVAIGPERKNSPMTDKDKEITAYHEGGHALVGHVLPNSDPIHKITILPRGGAAGITWSLPQDDKHHQSAKDIKDLLAQALGGRVAEEVIYGESNINTGASNDLMKVTSIARSYVVEYGMSKKLKNLAFKEEAHPYDTSGMMAGGHTQYSGKTAEIIDEEVQKLVDEATERARKVIVANHKYLDTLKDELIKKETLDEDEVNKILQDAKAPKEVLLN